jgi:hypothetical protein
LARYRDPLLGAAFELQSRLYNIVRLRFLETYYTPRDGAESPYAEASTLWLIGQYLAWVEILRREVQFLDLGAVERNRELQMHLAEITRAFASDSFDGPDGFRIFRADQRAIGGLMTVHLGSGRDERFASMGYEEFVWRRAERPLNHWFNPLARDLIQLADNPQHVQRLRELQRRLVDLIDLLDPERQRYPQPDTRGRLPPRGSAAITARSNRHAQIARFVYDEGDDPWGSFETWVETEGLDANRTPDGGRSVARRRTALSPTFEFEATYSLDRRFTFTGKLKPPGWARTVRLARAAPPLDSGGWRFPLTRRRLRASVNRLLDEYDRPRIR